MIIIYFLYIFQTHLDAKYLRNGLPFLELYLEVFEGNEATRSRAFTYHSIVDPEPLEDQVDSDGGWSSSEETVV